MTHAFTPWPKIARLNREIVVTEKIDGTNAAIGIEKIAVDLTTGVGREIEVGDLRRTNTSAIVVVPPAEPKDEFGFDALPTYYWVWAQSRKRVITPGGSTDNAGFAGWVTEHAEDLVDLLGEGLHFGEWWGRGIQRGYGLQAKRFSLFNTARYGDVSYFFEDGTGINAVPVLYQGLYGEFHIQAALERLHLSGSAAAPGFDRPEGIIVYHTAAAEMFKVTLEGDEAPKSLVQHG